MYNLLNFFWLVWLRISQSSLSFQRTNFYILDCLYSSFSFHFINFWPDLYYFFMPPNFTFGLFLFFGKTFRGIIRLFILDVWLFLTKSLIVIIFPLSPDFMISQCLWQFCYHFHFSLGSILFIFWFIYSFICMSIHCLVHVSLLPFTPSLSLPNPSLSPFIL
jgi:hypothetical protein